MFPPWRLWTLVVTGILFGLSADAQEPDTEAAGGANVAPLRQIYVPAGDPTSWPAGDWIPVASEELRELLSRSEAAEPPTAYLETAVYKARLSGTTLVGGTLEASARLRSRHPQFVDLGRPSLAISRLQWAGREAVWGLSDDARSLLRVDEDGAALTGRWSLSGRRVFSTIEFDLQILPATVSELELELPQARELTIDSGLISRVSDSPRQGWRIWHLDLGRRSSVRLIVSAPDNSSRTSPSELQVSQTSTYSFSDRDLRVQTDITIQSVAGEFQTLEVVAPPAMTFSSITAGNERILPAWRKQEQQRSLLVIDVSEIKLGPGTRLRLRGQLPLRPGSRQGLPRLGLLGARWLQMRRQVRVLSPLQLKDIDLSDSRLVNSSMGPDSGASLELDDLTPASQIRLTVDTPQPDLSANVLSRVDWQQSDPHLRTELNIEALTGSTYSLVCDVPADWEVTRVDAGSAMPVAQWQTSWDADAGRSQLFVEFRNALSPSSPVRISILARPRAASLGESIPIPVVMPRVSGERQIAVVMILPSGMDIELPVDSDYQAIELADLVAQRPELGEEFTEIRDSRLLVVQSADPGDDQQLTVRTSDGSAEPSGTFPAASSIDAGAASSTDTVPVVGEPIRAALDVVTLVAAERGRLCRNRVVLHLPPVAGPRTMRLELPDAVRLLTAESRLPVRTTRREVVVELPANTQGAKVTLEYESPLERSLLSGQAWIPLPRWNGEPTTISWQIDMPPALRLRNPTDGSTAVESFTLNWSQRLLGPLGRLPGGELFWPFSVSTWRSLRGQPSSVATEVGDSQRSFRSLAGERESLTLAFWDVTSARRLGWIVLLISMLMTAWPFRRDRLLRRGWTLKLVLLGMAAALLAPDMLAIPWGGFIMGASIGALLPESWRTPRRREVRDERSTFSRGSRLSLSATTGILLLSCLVEPVPSRAWQTSSEAASAELSAVPTSEDSAPLEILIPLDVESTRTQHLPPYVYVDRPAAQRVLARRITPPPRYLLRSADYEVDEFENPRPPITARFDVVLLQPESETRVVLALTGVQFPDAQLCRVDGAPAPLLPHRSGEGVVVVVPPGTAAEDGQETSVQVELVCQPRPAADQQSPRLAVGIPQVIASQLTIHSPDPSSPAIQAVHAGSFNHQKDRQRWRIVLGSQGYLVANPEEEASTPTRWSEPVSAASSIEAHPMRLRIDSRLAFRTRPQWARLDGRTLRLQLPSGSIVREIRADGLLHTQSARNGRNPVQLDLLFVEDVPAELSVDISFDLPAGRLEDGAGVVVPPLPFLVETQEVEFPVHHIGVAAALGFRLSAADPERSMPATTGIDESQLPAWRGSRTARASEATYQLTSSRSLELPLVPIEPSVNTSIRQTLTVRSATVNWAATLQMRVRDAPLALHRLQIDPRVNVRQVSVIQESVDRLASWSRTAPENLVLFLKEELSGTQTVHLKGSLAVDDRYDFVIPSLNVEGASLTEPPEVVVQHAAGIPVVVAADDGTVVAGGSETPTTEEVVQLPTLNHDPTLPPLRIQRDRSEPAFDIEQMTIIESLQQAEARWTRLVRIDTSRMPQQTLTVEVTATPPQVQLAASVLMAEEVVDGVTRLTLDLNTTDSDAIDITLTGRTPLSSGELPELRVAGAPLPQHLVVTLEGVDVAIEGQGESVDRDKLSAWARDNLTALERPVGRVLKMAQEPVQLTPAVDAGADAWLQRLDTAVWLQSDGHRRGVTVADITALRRTSVEWLLPPQMTLEFAELNGKSISPISATAYEIPASQMSQRLVLWWTEKAAAGEGLPLPMLANLTGATPHAVLFGTGQHIYMLDDSVPTIALEQLQENLTALDEQTDAASPILRALRAAGVGGPSAEGAFTTPTIHAVELNNRRKVIPIYLIERQLARVLGLLLAAGGVLIVWFVVGRWSDRIAGAARSFSGLPGLVVLAAAVWLLGMSWLGLLLLLLLISLWGAQLRQPPASEAQDSRLQSAR